MLGKNKKKAPIRATEETINVIASALRVGAHPNLCVMIMMEDGFSQQKANLIISWAKRINESHVSQT